MMLSAVARYSIRVFCWRVFVVKIYLHPAGQRYESLLLRATVATVILTFSRLFDRLFIIHHRLGVAIEISGE